MRGREPSHRAAGREEPDPLEGRFPPTRGLPPPRGPHCAIKGNAELKGHVTINPDFEIITDTVVSAGNAGGASVASQMVRI